MTQPKPGPRGDETLEQLARIIEVMRRLRDPKTGCPWDVEQTFATIAPYTIEEAYEVADAIARDDMDDIRDELGDLLLQVVFHARMAEEMNAFDLADVARSISDKMIERHPHVFGDEARPETEQQNRRWEEIKEAERRRRGRTGILDDVAAGLPPLTRAMKLQKRAARVGFDWDDPKDVIAKMEEECAELRREVEAGDAPPERIEDEIGDVLFVAVNIARKTGIDPETALAACNRKFERRFGYIESKAKECGRSLDDMSLDEMNALWRESKKAGC